MKGQLWDLNQPWPVGRKWCRFTNAPPPKKKGALPPNLWCKNIFDHLFVTSALDTAYLRNETSRQQTKMLVSIYNVSPKNDLFSATFDPETAEIRFLSLTHPRSTQPWIPLWTLNRVPASSGGKGGILTSVGWQVTLCDPIWHVSFP